MANGKHHPRLCQRRTPERTGAVARAIVREVLRDYPLLTPDEIEAAWHAADPLMRAALAQRRAGEASDRVVRSTLSGSQSARRAGVPAHLTTLPVRPDRAAQGCAIVQHATVPRSKEQEGVRGLPIHGSGRHDGCCREAL
jgi:hypothetical protein